jgi:hypothetical protein
VTCLLNRQQISWTYDQDLNHPPLRREMFFGVPYFTGRRARASKVKPAKAQAFILSENLVPKHSFYRDQASLIVFFR